MLSRCWNKGVVAHPFRFKSGEIAWVGRSSSSSLAAVVKGSQAPCLPFTMDTTVEAYLLTDYWGQVLHGVVLGPPGLDVDALTRQFVSLHPAISRLLKEPSPQDFQQVSEWASALFDRPIPPEHCSLESLYLEWLTTYHPFVRVPLITMYLEEPS